MSVVVAYIPDDVSMVSEDSESLVKRSNLNIDEFYLESRAEENLKLATWNQLFKSTNFSTSMGELDFCTDLLNDTFSEQTLCNLLIEVVQKLSADKKVQTIGKLILPCADKSLLQITASKLTRIISPSPLNVSCFEVPFSNHTINTKILLSSVVEIASRLVACSPKEIQFKLPSDASSNGIEEEQLRSRLGCVLQNLKSRPQIKCCIGSKVITI